MANVKFEFSDMEHPTADTPADTEVWTTARGLYKAELHWELGHTPDWIVCYFHDATPREFPWTRARATDENGPIGIWRFDTIEQMFEGGSRQWKATGRDALYGVQDNYLRSPRIKADEDPDNDDDVDYTEWPILPVSSLITLEDLESEFQSNDFRVVGCKRIQDVQGCGSATDPCTQSDATNTTVIEGGTSTFKVLPCVFDRNSDRDVFLDNNFAESRYNSEPSKLGPNYALKGVRRGWVFKDIMRHSSGSVNAASRPILAVYNRSLGGLGSIAGEGTPIRSNFQQAMSAGDGANALAYDVAVSWPWLDAPAQTEIEFQQEPAPTKGADTGYDYRTVWTGKADTYAPSGQALEVFRRGALEWDDAQGFGFCENEPCPGQANDPVITTLTFFQSTDVIDHISLGTFPTRAVICANTPGPDVSNIAGMGVLVTVIDTSLKAYDLSVPGTITEWTERLGLAALTGPGLSVFGASSGAIICEGGVDVSFGGRCWCVSHVIFPNIPEAATQTGVVAIYATPPETFQASAEKCGELSLNVNMGVFLHQTDVSKDYLCYHKAA